MKKILFALGAVLCLSVPVYAQDAAPAAPAGADQGPGPGEGGGGGGGGKGGKMKEILTSCRDQAKSQGLKGQKMKDAMMDCAQKANPKAAVVLKCRMEAKDKGMKGGSDEMKAYIKDCRKKAG